MKRPEGLAAFAVIWTGQLLSLLGSGLTSFATVYWVYQFTGDATSVSLMALCSFAPTVVVGPIAGALVDRWDRKLVMMISDIAAALATLAIGVLYVTGDLAAWHLYAAGAFSGAFESFQWPAYTAAMSSMVPKAHYSRANGMISLAASATSIAAPILAGILLPLVGIAGIFLIDFGTFVIGLLLLTIVVVPNPPKSPESLKQAGSLWREVALGFRFVLSRRGLLGLQVVFLFMNLFNNLGQPIRQTLVLARTAYDPSAMAAVGSAMAFGSLAGSLLMTAWKGFRRKVHGVLIGMALHGLLGTVIFGLGRALPVWLAAGFAMQVFLVVLQSSASAIWQSKVPLDMQGRVMATRRLIAHAAIPLGMALSGPLADYVLEPAMRSDGALASLFGGLVGTGPGAGMALILVLAGLLSSSVGLAGFLSRSIREVDTALPDHDQVVGRVAGQTATVATGD